ncbi:MULTISPECIES: MerR family transcriptional regulator [unclassified Streptomyces]|uniref:MerR family transcriptional regulator n=1 Tax=unclassified Streptomyces TaxID=2593676 RepID=UPI000DBA4BCE|nr:MULTISPECIES: MerR family transcriptional regulator [unclassified Streptomyces]MYT70792.1 MerR family transcriptional regulator [Streptomyces sp. SID8367]RAJ90497.1 DNA-binding transcriptional MerR regulator [Streptomyces sp. PsTaAH-137]
MRIGELARIVGVTTRAIRHYHHLGLLPEPERLGNGYREYGLRHAVELARIRRLTELGLGLGEVRDVLAEDAGRDLVEVLAELDADLARQEAALHERRVRLRALLDDAERQGGLPAGSPLSPELASFFAKLGDVDLDSPMAVKDREVLALVDATAPPEARAELMAVLGPALTAPGALDSVREVYALLDALAEAGPDDPRVAEAARALLGWLPADLPTAEGIEQHALLDAFLGDFSPAQAEAVRLAMRMAEEER